MKALRRISLFDLILCVGLYLSIFCNISLTVDGNFTTRILLTKIYLCICVAIFVIARILKLKIKVNFTHIAFILLITANIEALYGLLQHWKFIEYYSSHPLTGHYENPAGFIVIIISALPFALCLIHDLPNLRRLLVGDYIFLCASIIISESRAGILAMVIVSIIFILYCRKVTLKRSLVIIMSCGLGLLILLYLCKIDSADGRILIWRSMLPILSDVPLTGFGSGAFERLYMTAQSEYLITHPSDANIQIAGCVYYPFNEYLNLYLERGLVGVLLFLCSVLVTVRQVYIAPKSENITCFAVLCLIGLISLFSYPLRYPFTQLILALSVLIIFRSSIFNYESKNTLQLCLPLALLLVSINLSNFYCDELKAEIQWRDAYLKRNLQAYNNVHSKLKHNGLFLYNYASELYEQQQYTQSLQIAKECATVMANYELELLFGDIFTQQKQWNLALQHYNRAHAMCPNRFLPLYQIFEVYSNCGDSINAKRIAVIISNKSVKIESSTVLTIKQKANEYLQNKQQL